MTTQYIGTINLYEHPGTDGGTWYAAQYPPHSVTRYYRTEQARSRKVNDYIVAMNDFGGLVTISHEPDTLTSR